MRDFCSAAKAKRFWSIRFALHTEHLICSFRNKMPFLTIAMISVDKLNVHVFDIIIWNRVFGIDRCEGHCDGKRWAWFS